MLTGSRLIYRRHQIPSHVAIRTNDSRISRLKRHLKLNIFGWNVCSIERTYREGFLNADYVDITLLSSYPHIEGQLFQDNVQRPTVHLPTEVQDITAGLC